MLRLLLIMFTLASVSLMPIRSSAAALQTVTVREYVAAAEAALRERAVHIPGRLELRARGTHRDLKVASETPVRLHVRPQQFELSSFTLVWIDVFAGEHVVRRVPVRFAIECLRPALVATRRLSGKTALAPDMFELREIDVARFGGRVAYSVAELEGMRLKRDLDAGTALSLDAIEHRPPVEVGERIQVIASVGHVVVSTTAIAQRDGFPGERIGATLVNGGETIRVEIVGEDTAKVQGDG